MKIKKMLNKCLVLGVFSFVFTACGKSGYSIPDSIRGVKITPCSLAQLAPKVPGDLQRNLDAWFSDPKTQPMLDGLTSVSDITAWQADRGANQALMANLGYKNWSNHRYISEIPGGEYIFKVAGQKDRLISMLATKGIVLSPEQQEDESFKAYVVRYLAGQDLLPTYNTASGIAYYELLKERIKKAHYRHVYAPQTYLVQIPGKPNTIADGNVMAVQKVIPGTEKLNRHPEMVATISNSVLTELYDAVVALGLWNIKENLLVKKDGSICLTCSVGLVGLTEQKNSSAKDFFHKSKERFDEDVHVGLVGLLDLFKDDAAKTAYIQKHIRKDTRLKHSSYHDKLMELAQK